MTVTQQLADDVVVVREAVPSSDVVRVRFGDVDGLRALAIVLIVAYQVMRFDGLPAKVAPALARLAADASQGLALFLALSAFAIAYPVLATMRADGAAYLDVGRFIVKRLLRVYPAFLAVTIVAALIAPLAILFNAPGVGHAVPAMTFPTFVRDIAFLGDSTHNDGAHAVAIVLRSYIMLPFVLLLWVRARWVAIGLAIGAGVVDVTTAVGHDLTAAAVVPLVLGIAAADLRAQNHKIQSIGLPLAAIAGLAAFFFEPRLTALAGATGAPDALRVDPLWSIACFGLIAGIGAARLLERIAGFAPFRLIGVASYAISLVVMPVTAFCVRQVPSSLGLPTIAAVAACASLILGFGLWHTVDRWFATDGLRRSAAQTVGAFLDRILAKGRLSRLVVGTPAKPPAGVVDDRVGVDPAVDFYAPPPRPTPPPADLAILSTRTGSADDLAAEIIETKRRLTERTAAFFTPEPQPQPPPPPPAQEPEPQPVEAVEAVAKNDESRFEKPGFYRRSTNGLRPAPKPDVVVLGLPPVSAVAPARAQTPVTIVAADPVAAPPVAAVVAAPIVAAHVVAAPIVLAAAPVIETPTEPEAAAPVLLVEAPVSQPVVPETVVPAPDSETVRVPDRPSLDLSSILPPAPVTPEPEPESEPITDGRRPRAKASLLDRVANHARRSGAPEEPVPVAAATTEVAGPPEVEAVAPDVNVLAAEFERATADLEPVAVASPTIPGAAPARSSIRLRIGPEPVVARSDADRG